MPMYPFFNPARFGTEFIYTIIVVFLCFLVYHKTKDMYNLTKHKGIGYFRKAFLFFGLAYASRFLLHILTFTTRFFFDIFFPRKLMFPLVIIPVGYLSTIAIFYLTYSTIWKKIRYKHFITIAHIIAILVSAIAFISRSHILLSSIQLVLLVFTVIISARRHKTKKHARELYIFVSLFWLINLFLIGPRIFFPFEVKIILQALSLVVFIAIYYKVAKWIK